MDVARRAVLAGLCLTPSDFRLLVGGEEVPVEEVELIPATRSEMPARAPAAVEEPGTPELPEGRLIVLLFQADFGRYRTKGLMRMANETLTRLEPETGPLQLGAASRARQPVS